MKEIRCSFCGRYKKDITEPIIFNDKTASGICRSCLAHVNEILVVWLKDNYRPSITNRQTD